MSKSEKVYEDRQAKYGSFKDNLAKYCYIRESMHFLNASDYSYEVGNGVELIFQLLSLKAFRWQYCQNPTHKTDSVLDFVNYFFMLKELGVEKDIIFDYEDWNDSITECLDYRFTMSKGELESRLLKEGILKEIK